MTTCYICGNRDFTEAKLEAVSFVDGTHEILCTSCYELVDKTIMATPVYRDWRVARAEFEKADFGLAETIVDVVLDVEGRMQIRALINDLRAQKRGE